jgi:hypothetical protein
MAWRGVAVCVLVFACGRGPVQNAKTDKLASLRRGEDDREFAPFVKATEPHLEELGFGPEPGAAETWVEAKPGELFAAVTDPRVLMALEQRGLTFAKLLGSEARSNKHLYKESALYRDFVSASVEDIAGAAAEENKYRPDWGEVGTTMQNLRRSFDPLWLSAESAHYELIGIVNRMDRAVFAPETCGEVRLLFRLAYRTERLASRLPLTINLIYLLPKRGSCKKEVERWRAPKARGVDAVAEWLLRRGPVRPEVVTLSRLASFETNYQVIRSAAGIRNQLGGTAEYILRVFRLKEGRLVRHVLENTPDVARLAGDPALQRELLDFLRKEQQLAAIDDGTLFIPEKFLATRASSFAPHGIARKQNRPYADLFAEKDFAGLDFGRRNHVKSASALLRRLDDLSCVGCHQNRTIAGFHFLGEDRPGTHPLNAVFFAGSGHFRADLERRETFLAELAAGRTPAPDRPFSIAPTAARAQYGDFCGLPGAEAFAHWQCAEGLACQVIDPAENETELGKCFPNERLSGDPCIQNRVRQNHHSLDKMVMPWTVVPCKSGDPDYVCRMPGEGFPSGMCTTRCDRISDGREICGPTAGTGFSDCLGSGTRSFDACLELHKEAASRGRCNAERSCRNDYVCAKTSDRENGACVPAYFLFQVRVDGHPPPE